MSAGSAQTHAAEGPPIPFLGRLALMMGSSFNGIGIFTIGIPLPAMRAEFASAPHAAMLIPAIAGIGGPAFALTSPAFGRLVDRLGYRTVYLAGILFYVLGGVAPVVLDNLWLILLSRVVIALGVSASLAASLAGIASLPAQQRPGMFGMLNLMGSVTIAAAYPLVGLLVKHGWHYSFLIHLALLPVLALVLGLPGATPKASADAADAPRGSILGGLQPPLVLAIAIFGLSMSSGSFYGPTYMAEVGIPDPAKSGLSLSIMSLMAMVGSGAYGPVHRAIGTRSSLVVFLTIFGLGGVLIAMTGSWTLITVGFCLAGIGTVGYIAALYTSISETLGERSGPALGAANLALYGSQIFFPILASQIGARFGGSVLFLLVSIATLVVTLPITMVIARRSATPAAVAA